MSDQAWLLLMFCTWYIYAIFHMFEFCGNLSCICCSSCCVRKPWTIQFSSIQFRSVQGLWTYVFHTFWNAGAFLARNPPGVCSSVCREFLSVSFFFFCAPRSPFENDNFSIVSLIQIGNFSTRSGPTPMWGSWKCL